MYMRDLSMSIKGSFITYTTRINTRVVYCNAYAIAVACVYY